MEMNRTGSRKLALTALGIRIFHDARACENHVGFFHAGKRTPEAQHAADVHAYTYSGTHTNTLSPLYLFTSLSGEGGLRRARLRGGAARKDSGLSL